MESLAIKRRERGEVTQADIDPFLLMSTDDLLCKLRSPTPTIRTCAATVLSNHKESEVVKETPMILFKITRCFSGFSDNLAKQFLYNRLKSSDLGLQFEAARSLVLSGLNLPVKDDAMNEDVLEFSKHLTKKYSGRKKPRR